MIMKYIQLIFLRQLFNHEFLPLDMQELRCALARAIFKGGNEGGLGGGGRKKFEYEAD